MAMTVQARTMDPATLAAGNTNSGSTASSQSTQDKRDFGGMVRQKQQEVRKGADSQTGQKDAAAERKTDTETVSASKDGQSPQEIPHEQYILAAALILPANVEIITFEALPEENNLAAELEPAFIPDMHIESLTDLPVAEVPEDNNRPLFENRQENELPEEFRVVEEDAPEYVPVEDTGVQAAALEEDEETEDPFGIAAEFQWETPVFGYMEASPVKVSAPVTEEQPVELEAYDGMEQLSARIEEFVTDEAGTSRVEFTLVPASLGKVTVEITRTADGSLHIQLNATTLRASELLQRGSGTLQHLLGAGSRPEVRIEVRTDTDAQQMYLNPNANGEQQRQRQRQEQRRQEEQRRDRHQTTDFLQQLRLGLVEVSALV